VSEYKLDFGEAFERLKVDLREELLAEIAAARDAAAPEWLDVAAAANYLGCTKGRLYKLVQRREVAYVQESEGARLFFNRADLDEYMLCRRVPARGGDA
jgi:excisionase family DNA binding protein